jgi:2-(1,2-epoxy-1,2-dihydrophenyl)acetyl-CoA isomerase
MEMGSESLLREQRGPVLLLTLNRPDVLNALSRDLVVGLRDAMQSVASDTRTRTIVLTGAGRAFSSGADLAELDARHAAGDIALGDDLRLTYAPLIRAMRDCPQPVIAAINGVAAGAGLSLALAADLRLASRSAQLVLAFIRIGLVPDAGALFFLSRMVGFGRATEMAMRGEPVTAEAALQMGLVSAVVDDTAILEAALDRAAELAARPAGALRLTKTGLNRAAMLELDAVLDMEAELQQEAAGMADHRAAVRAFVERKTRTSARP